MTYFVHRNQTSITRLSYSFHIYLHVISYHHSAITLNDANRERLFRPLGHWVSLVHIFLQIPFPCEVPSNSNTCGKMSSKALTCEFSVILYATLQYHLLVFD